MGFSELARYQQLHILLAILSIDRSGPRFKSLTGGKIRNNLKSDENFAVFCEFLVKSDSKFLRPDQQNERRDIQLSNQKSKKLLLSNVNRPCQT